MNGTAIKQVETKSKQEPKNKSFLWDGFMNLVPNAGPEVKQAKVTPAALALQSNEIPWSPTPTWFAK